MTRGDDGRSHRLVPWNIWTCQGPGGQDGTPRKIRAEGLIQRGSGDVLQRAGEAQPEWGGSTAASRGALTPSGRSARIGSSSSAVVIDSSLASRPAEG